MPANWPAGGRFPGRRGCWAGRRLEGGSLNGHLGVCLGGWPDGLVVGSVDD